MKQVLIDMDGVLADVYTLLQHIEKEEKGYTIPSDQLIGKAELDAFPDMEEHIHSKGFFRNIPVMKNSIEGLRYLNDKYKVLIVSSATKYPHSLEEKMDWLNKYFPFISWKQIIFCGEKSSIKGDIMIDDHSKNLDVFDGEKILFTQPHNMLLDSSSYKRARDWKEIMEIL